MKNVYIIFVLLISACAGYTPHNWQYKVINAAKVEELERNVEIERLINDLNFTDEVRRKLAFDKLVSFGKYAQPALLRTARGISDKVLSVSTVKVLSAMDDPTLSDKFIELARDALLPDVRYEALNSLGKLKDRASVPALIFILEREKVDVVKGKIIYTLGKLKDERAVEPILKYLTSPSSSIRQNVFSALGEIGSENAVLPLTSYWKHILGGGSPQEKARIALAFGKIKSKYPVKLLTSELLNSTSLTVRQSCAEALGNIGDKDAVPHLVKALLDESQTVFESVHFALVRITGEDFYTAGDTPRSTQNKTYEKWMKWLAGQGKLY